MSSLQIGRLLVGPPVMFSEQIGDPVTTLGGAVVPNTRTAPQFQATIGTWAADGGTDTPAARLILRRQLRSLMNNSPMKLQAFVYLQYSDDTENNGWFVPDQGMLEDMFAPSGLATGLWQLATQNWYLVGHRRTHREARQAWLKDLRTGLYQRDYLGWVYSTDFSALPTLALSVLPSGATSPQDNVTGQVPAMASLATGRDGGVNLQVVGLSNLQVVSFERPEASIGLGDVIVYDRMGQITAPSTGPDTSWVEVYGPDWQWNWLTSGQANDCPVLDNGLVRVRYDASQSDPGLTVDAWNGTVYVEQGKFVFYHHETSGGGYCNSWVSASLVEWTPERAVMQLILSVPSFANSRERIFVTMRRGVTGCTVEYYPAPGTTGTSSDGWASWNAYPGDANASVIKVDSQTQPPPVGSGQIVATAGTGSTAFPTGILGASNFSSSENYAVLLRCSAIATPSWEQQLIVSQAANALVGVGYSTPAYTTSTNFVQVRSQNGAGYIQAQIHFRVPQAQQVLEAESMTLGTGTSSTADGSASNGHAATATRTTDANAHVSVTTWPNNHVGQYRVFIRVKVSAGTASFYAKTSATTGTTVTSAAQATPVYAWLDLGEIASNSSTLEIHAWISTGTGTVYVDRMESYLTQDNTAHGGTYTGARDQGQAALTDSRMLGAVVAR